MQNQISFFARGYNAIEIRAEMTRLTCSHNDDASSVLIAYRRHRQVAIRQNLMQFRIHVVQLGGHLWEHSLQIQIFQQTLLRDGHTEFLCAQKTQQKAIVGAHILHIFVFL